MNKFMKIIVSVFFLVILVISFTSAQSYNGNYGAYGSNYLPNSVQFKETWDFQENLRGKNKGFQLTRTVDVPSNVQASSFYSTTPGYYGVPQNQFSSFSYTPYATDNYYGIGQNSYQGTYNNPLYYQRSYPNYNSYSQFPIAEAFRTFQQDSHSTKGRYYGGYVYSTFPSFYYKGYY